MRSRREKVKKLMEGFQSLRRTMAFRMPGSAKLPRITPSQWGALMMIGHGGKSTVKDVANALGISSSAATQLADGLVESGYVTREEHAKDRRSVTLTLSLKTKKQVERMKEQAARQFLKFFEVLDDREFDQLILLHKKIFERHSIPRRNSGQEK